MNTENVVHTDTSNVLENVQKKARGAPGRPRVANSALSRAREIYQANPSAVRADVVNKFIAAGISKPIANTYYHLLRRSSQK
jgi:hypothetical protein